ncbi:MAG TPA: cache domain-containing protein [Patescibacteria group bacterium]|nr:cache domain-containing protein [Patescibacteria group bacterium]
MNQFWLEFFYFIVSAFAILVSISAASLFALTFRFEKRLRTVWRATGFFALALSFFLLILERKFSQVGLVALLVEFIAFYCIFRGVLEEPILSHLGRDPEKFNEKPKDLKLKEVTSRAPLKKNKLKPAGFFERLQENLINNKNSKNKKEPRFTTTPVAAVFGKSLRIKKENLILAICFFVYIILAVFCYILYRPYTPALLILGAFIFILSTMPIQVKRYFQEKGSKKVDKQNLYPLIGYVFLLLGTLFTFFYRLPDFNIVFLHQLKIEYGVTWGLILIAYFFGFFFLAIWAWNFIKLRVFLRTFVVFLTAAIVVSALGSLVFTILIFGTVEKNNLQLMSQGAQTQKLIMIERSNNALALARNIANDERIAISIELGDSDKIFERIAQYSGSSQLDTLRIFDANRKILQDLNDPRNIGKVYSEDPILAYVLNNKKHIQSFSADPGVLAYVMNARGLAPVLSNGNIVGAVEVGYKFDNAFVDFSKKQTGLDVTIYTGSKIAATTIETVNGISRWIGSKETDQAVVKNVLEKGESYSVSADRLGQIYYNSFEPVRDINGLIIGMVSVGAPTNVLFESTRQQLVSAFLIMTLISLVVVLIGYFAIRKFQRNIS